MLRGKDIELKRIGAKQVYNNHLFRKPILAWLNDDILNNYQHVKKDKLHLDTLAWEMKALAGSREEAYKDTFIKITEDANSKYIRKYAKRYLKYYKK